MNTNPNAIRILCYGDSNTWGYTPITGERFSVDLRYPGMLQGKLGSNFEVIEEGLNGRTTNADDPKRRGRNGEIYIIPCLETHNPLDLIILMLGTNDLRKRINRTAQQAAQEIERLIKIGKEYGKDKNGNPPKIIIISPALVGDGVEDEYQSAVEKSKQLGNLYEEVAKRNGCGFLDAAKIVSPSPKDSLHLEPEGHKKLAEAIHSKIRSLRDETPRDD